MHGRQANIFYGTNWRICRTAKWLAHPRNPSQQRVLCPCVVEQASLRREWRAWGVHVTLPSAPTAPGRALSAPRSAPRSAGPPRSCGALDAMADLISSGELGRRPGQERLDILLVADATRCFLTGSVQKYFSATAQITLTVTDVKKVAGLLAANSFDIVFLKVTSTLTVEELEAVKLISFGQLKSDPELGEKAPLSGPQRTRKTSLLHSSKEKLRRERIKFSCQQLRMLLPHVKGRKSDVASVIEATVDYVKYVRENLSPAVMAKIKETIENNKRFSKRHVPIDLFLPCAATSQREDAVLTSAYASVREIQLLADQCLSVYPVPAAGRPVEETVRGPSSSVSESPIEDLVKTRVPGSVALSLSPFHAVRCCSGTVPPQDTAARKNQNVSIYLPSAAPSGSSFLPQHCSSMLCQTRPASSSCRCTTPGHKFPASSRAASCGVFSGLQDSDPDHQASQQPRVSDEPSPPPQEDDYF
ncbi:Spermatogenesis- and oogenesis-specific basic helix-loop-helix-containing protein 2 [Microtus ochrogaster]|uniref:Spermatogenesis- and oogenesis-specific basic helix-loop-helix-containing protein 2 n=1 Tax=Microtus ochrogaster TaxID=79684 RepID=A0A8J6G9Q3_MICOH|nr:Spermatogenesis- and oogenesis-specific basic helix-loop-helix-containing protein 2 [Microtus ochrogaster]